MTKPRGSGAFYKRKDFKPGGKGMLISFNCEDCSIEAGRATATGGKQNAHLTHSHFLKTKLRSPFRPLP